MIWDPVEQFLWGFALAILLICVVMFFFRGHQKENKEEKNILYSFAFLFLGFLLYRFFYNLAELQVKGIYLNDVYIADYSSLPLEYYIYLRITCVSIQICFILFFFKIESTVKRSKYLFTIISCFLLIVPIITPNILLRSVFLLSYSINCIIMWYILFSFSANAEYEFKAISFLICLAVAFLVFSTILFGKVVKSMNAFPLIMPAIMYIIGAFLGLSSTLIDPKHFSKMTLFLAITGIAFLCFNWFLIIYFILIGVLLYVIVMFTIVSIVALLLFIRVLKDLKTHQSKGKREAIINIYKPFARPQKLTEEEVSVAKEKKICLVCKGKLARNMYICPDCSTFYCSKCAEALVNLENACWVCETPFDESKPVRLPEKKEEELLVEEVDLKKIKKK